MTSIADAGSDRFNSEAAAWDTQPFIHEATRLAFEALRPAVHALTTHKGANLDVLDIGCGTGLLSAQVAPLVEEVVAIDPAEGMIDMLKAKLCDGNASMPKNILPVCRLLEDPEDPVLPADRETSSRRKFDVVVSHLVLHHIPNLRTFLRTLLGCLRPGGRVALTDYEDFGLQAKKFHPESKWDTVERHGIQRAWMEGLMREAGFSEVSVREAFTLNKDVERWEETDGDAMEFPFIICEGVRMEQAG
jgi:SAM-dependent methyltransferase